jgi:chorismate synthase
VSGAAAGAATGVTIRALARHEELVQCAALQRQIWGAEFGELVPPAILWVAGRTGGVIAGAFDEAGRMIGFVFGLTGWRDGRPIHWSDMLAVSAEARGHGVGRLLKQYQRRTLLERGVHEAEWTFDPLESQNAFINFARLGITAREYIRDCYGESSSPLHQGLGTDRLVASWRLGDERVSRRMAGAESAPASAAAAAGLAGTPVINPGGAEPRLDLDAPLVRLQVPADVQALKLGDAAAVVRWRDGTRAAFETYFGRGYEAVDFVRESAALSSYVLRRGLAT